MLRNPEAWSPELFPMIVAFPEHLAFVQWTQVIIMWPWCAAYVAINSLFPSSFKP